MLFVAWRVRSLSFLWGRALMIVGQSITEDDWYDDLGAGEQEALKNWEGYGVY
jgi:hypothetical protein